MISNLENRNELIYNLYITGQYSYKELADKFNISKSRIGSIILNAEKYLIKKRTVENLHKCKGESVYEINDKSIVTTLIQNKIYTLPSLLKLLNITLNSRKTLNYNKLVTKLCTLNKIGDCTAAKILNVLAEKYNLVDRFDISKNITIRELTIENKLTDIDNIKLVVTRNLIGEYTLVITTEEPDSSKCHMVSSVSENDSIKLYFA